MKIVIHGAGGPVARSAIEALQDHHELLLTDVQPLDSPHPTRVVDITDAQAVADAAAGQDVILNCTVIRKDPDLPFDVNLRGAWHVMRSAVAHGVPRVIHTGPAMLFGRRATYRMLDEPAVEAEPPSPGWDIYILSKTLGWEVVRAFCREHPELCVVAFVYSGFYWPEQYADRPGIGREFAVDARDAGQAFRLGVEVPRERLPSNCELFNINADQPDGRVPIDKARRILGYAPRHNFEAAWSRTARAAWEAQRQAGEAE